MVNKPDSCKKIIRKREVGMLESLYSGTFKRFATKVPSIPQRSPQVTLNVSHKM
jgi:hypothetical protein